MTYGIQPYQRGKVWILVDRLSEEPTEGIRGTRTGSPRSIIDWQHGWSGSRWIQSGMSGYKEFASREDAERYRDDHRGEMEAALVNLDSESD